MSSALALALLVFLAKTPAAPAPVPLVGFS